MLSSEARPKCYKIECSDEATREIKVMNLAGPQYYPTCYWHWCQWATREVRE